MRGTTKSDMAAFGASDASCYAYPDDTDIAKAQRAAFCAGAAWSADEIEQLQAVLVRIGIINASGGRYDPEIDRVIRECADEQRESPK